MSEHYIMEQQASFCTGSGGGDRPPCVGRLCGVTPRAARLVAARRWCSAETEAVDTRVHSANAPALHPNRHSAFFILFWPDSCFGLGLCHVLFLRHCNGCMYIFVSCTAGERIPAGLRRLPAFPHTHTSSGTAFYNGFLLPLFETPSKRRIFNILI